MGDEVIIRLNVVNANNLFIELNELEYLSDVVESVLNQISAQLHYDDENEDL